MVDVSVDIDNAALQRLDALLQKVYDEMPNRLATETLRAGVYICQSLARRTKVAKNKAPRKELVAMPSYAPPRYVHSNSAHRHLLRRWYLARKQGTPDAYGNHYFVYTDAQRVKRGKRWVMAGKNPSKERKELIDLHAGISRPGLAKKSWGWIAKGLHGTTGGDLSWRRTRGERRDPRKYVHGIFTKSRNGATAKLENLLDYAKAALKPGALNEAINAATKRLEYNIQNHLERAGVK